MADTDWFALAVRLAHGAASEADDVPAQHERMRRMTNAEAERLLQEDDENFEAAALECFRELGEMRYIRIYCNLVEGLPVTPGEFEALDDAIRMLIARRQWLRQRRDLRTRQLSVEGLPDQISLRRST